MGLAASQARKLLLAAKRNDLEFRAQQISHRRLLLSSQLEQYSTEYEAATSNRQMKLRMTDGSTNADGNKLTQELNLTYANLVSGTTSSSEAHDVLNKITNVNSNDDFTCNTAFLLTDTSGRIIVADASEIPGYPNNISYSGANSTTSSYGIKNNTLYYNTSSTVGFLKFDDDFSATTSAQKAAMALYEFFDENSITITASEFLKSFETRNNKNLGLDEKGLNANGTISKTDVQKWLSAIKDVENKNGKKDTIAVCLTILLAQIY